MPSPRTIAIGVAIGLVVGGLYIGLDQMRSADAPTAVASAAADSASVQASSSPKKDAAPAASAASSSTAAPSASASGGQPGPARPDMKWIPAANYQPTFLSHRIDVKGFWLDTTEVTQKAYLACVEATGCTPNTWARSGAKLEGVAESLPATDISWDEARAFCAWEKRRLPTEIEWELAARGAEGRKYPWGEEPPSDQLCWRANGPCSVGTFARGDTPLGVKDMGGNAWEWVADARFCKDPDLAESCDAQRHILRGGSWNAFSPQVLETSFRSPTSIATNSTGFRCAD